MCLTRPTFFEVGSLKVKSSKVHPEFVLVCQNQICLILMFTRKFIHPRVIICQLYIYRYYTRISIYSFNHLIHWVNLNDPPDKLDRTKMTKNSGIWTLYMLWCTRPTLSEWLYIDYLIALLPNQPGKLKDPSKGIFSLDHNRY